MLNLRVPAALALALASFILSGCGDQPKPVNSGPTGASPVVTTPPKMLPETYARCMRKVEYDRGPAVQVEQKAHCKSLPDAAGVIAAQKSASPQIQTPPPETLATCLETASHGDSQYPGLSERMVSDCKAKYPQ
jgi:hypothetical protein